MSKNALHIVLKIVVNICRFLLAATFLFSGFVKANDPLGMVYKLEDYFSAWGITGVPGLFTLLMAMGIALFEFVLCICFSACAGNGCRASHWSSWCA